MDVDAPAEKAARNLQLYPEIEIFAYLVTLILLMDSKEYSQAVELSKKAIATVSPINRRTADILIARVFFYFSLSHEKIGQLKIIRPTLMHRLTTTVLQHDELGQEVIQNLLLHNFLHYNQYDQAEKFRAQAPRTEITRSTQQYCRYLYYFGRIKTIQLEYIEAKEYLQQAARKAPLVAGGFRVIVSKWLILVRLLLGETPERMEFNHPLMKTMLEPYFEIT